MTIAPYELLPEPGGVVARIRSRGSAVLTSPSINKGAASTLDERAALGLDGLLPTGVTTLEPQLRGNNALVFPGLGLEVSVVGGTRISDRMIAAAADAVAGLSDATIPGAPLLPPMTGLRAISAGVALAIATTAMKEGLARVELDDPIQQIHDTRWRPVYPRVAPEGN